MQGSRRLTSHRDPPPQSAAKTSPPRLQAPSIRADQFAAVAAAAQAQLLLVRAPAGYGKTTLVAAAADELDWPCVWYRLDALDADAHEFLAALGRALDERLPGFDARLREAPGPADRPTAAKTAALLAGEIARLAPGELYLILDDYGKLAGEEAFNAALAALLAYAPPSVHVVLLSRARPGFATARLAMDGELAELRRDRLHMDAAQVAAVVEERSGRRPVPAEAEELLAMTEGWPAGVVLAAGSAEPSEPIGAYLAEEVYGGLAAEERSFLLRSSCLHSMTPALAATVTGVRDAGRLLAGLEAHGAFTFAGPVPGAYHCHPLLRGFLGAQVTAEGGQDALMALQARSARALAGHGRAPEAIRLYLEAGDAGATVELLRAEGYGLLRRCEQNLLSPWVDALRGAGEEFSGWATLLQGHRLSVAGDLADSRRRLDAGLAALSNDPGGSYLCLRALTYCCYMQGSTDEAISYARQALEASSERDAPESLFALAQALSATGRWDGLDEVEAQFAASGNASPELAADMTMLAVHRDYTSGDVRAALARGEAELASVLGSASRLTAASFLLALAAFNLFACRYPKGAGLLDEVHREVDALGPHMVGLQMDVVRGMYLAQQGRLRECLGLLDGLRAEPLAQSSRDMRFNIAFVEAVALRRAGEPGRAAHSCQRALATINPDSTVYDRLDVLTETAYLEGLGGARRHALARLHQLRHEAEQLGLRFHAGKAGFFAGALELRAGDDGSAELGRSCSELLALGQLDFLGQELAAVPDVAAQLAAAGVTEDELRELLRVSALQVGGPALVASLAGHDPRLLALSISLARTDLPEREASELLQALRRHRSREVRDRARRVDLGPWVPARLFLELTDREEEVLALLAEGCSNAEIARRLVLTIGTVKTHVHRILTKTETHGRLAAAVLYRKRIDAAGEAAVGKP